MTCEIDIIAALGAAATLIYPEPDVYEVWDLGSDEFAVVFADADRVVRIEPLTIVPDDEWPFDESGVVGIERPTPPPPLPDLADDPFSDLPADASDEQAVVRGLIDKTETAYDVVQHALVQLRRCGRVPYEWLRDGTRQTFKPTTYSSVGDAIQDIVDGYRKALWDEADVRVEVWLEKDALTDVVYSVTNVYDVPLRVARGFSSLSFLADAATEMEADGKDVYVYHLGDHDPSGRSAGEAIERDLTELAPSVEFHFERIAVTVEQIAGFDLPTDQAHRFARGQVRSRIRPWLGRTGRDSSRHAARHRARSDLTAHAFR
jgi:hypothetical protein